MKDSPINEKKPKSKLNWRMKVSSGLVSEWRLASKQVRPMYYVERYVGKIERYIIYCDASDETHGAVIYGVVGQKMCAVYAKAKLNKDNMSTTPRRELAGAAVAVEIAKTYSEYISNRPVTFMTDSTTVLHYLSN